MSEPSPTPTTPASTTEKTVVIPGCHLKSLWTLTLIGLALNLLILALLVIGAIIHRHMVREMAQGNGPQGGPAYAQAQGGFGPHFGGMRRGGGGGRYGGGGRGNFGGGRFGGQGYGHNNFGGNGGGGGNGGPGPWGGGPGRNGPGPRNGGPGDGGGPFGGGFGGGPGMRGGGMGGGHNGPPDPALMTDRLFNRLSRQLWLTDDEKAKIKPLLDAQAAQMQKDMEAQRDARQKSMDETKAKIKALLTPDQQKQFDAMPMPPPGGPKPGP